MRNGQIVHMEFPSYKELSVAKVWPEFKDDQHLMRYMPDLEENELPEKEFFFGILTTLYEDEVQKLIENARNHRATKEEDKENNLVEIKSSILQEIDALMDFKSKI